jgi:hypothetical protein
MVSFPTVYRRVIAHRRVIVFLLIFAFCAYPLTHPGKFESIRMLLQRENVVLTATRLCHPLLARERPLSWIARVVIFGELLDLK